jgi:hypothetical protein
MAVNPVSSVMGFPVAIYAKGDPLTFREPPFAG